MFELIVIAFAFYFGLLFKKIGFPPLIGYLVAGFFIAQYSSYLPLYPNSNEILEHVAHLGVLLLLFTIGLKLKVKNVFKSEVLGVSILQFGLSTLITLPVFMYGFGMDMQKSLMLSIALTFSSTVLVAKILEEKKELKAFHGRVAIGVLIMQDLIALLVMSISKGVAPSYWSLLLFALPLARPLLYKLLDMAGHDELLVLFGLFVAIGLGGVGFESLGLSSELGALVFGALFANHPKVNELSKSLWSVKEFFLVAFFLTIGKNGFPELNDWILAGVILLLLPLKGLVFFIFASLFRLKSRTAFLTSVSLANYSEFGLIMAALVLPDMLVPLALSVALSFVISSPLNKYAHDIYEKIGFILGKFERKGIHPDEQSITLGDAQVMVLGLGRIGFAAYKEMCHFNSKIVGLDSDQELVKNHIAKSNINALYADVENKVFWNELDISKLNAVVVCINNDEASLISIRKLRKKGFKGTITAHTMYEDVAKQLNEAGADATYLTMEEAGVGIANNTIHLLEKKAA